MRKEIAAPLRSLLAAPDAGGPVRSRVLGLSQTYDDLDGENNHNDAKVFADVYKTLTADQKTRLAALRKSIWSGTSADGTSFDFSTASDYCLCSTVIKDPTVLIPYIDKTDSLFFEP